MRWILALLCAALLASGRSSPAAHAQADVGQRVQKALDEALARGDVAAAEWDLPRALLDYGSAFLLFPDGGANASIYGKIAPVHGRLALREPARLKRLEDLLREAACRRGPKPDPRCVEEYAAVLLRLERPAAAEQLSLLARLASADPTTTVLARFADALASIQIDGVLDGEKPPPGPSPNQTAVDLLQALARRTEPPRLPAAESVLAYYNLIWAHAHDPKWERDSCLPPPRPEAPSPAPPQLASAEVWARRSEAPDAARELVLARLAECAGDVEAALAGFRAGLVLPFRLFPDAFRREALGEHPSLMYYLADRETRLEEIVRRRAEAGALRVQGRLLRPALGPPSFESVTIVPSAIVAPGEPMAAETGPPSSPLPVLISATVSAPRWLREVTVRVEDVARPGTRAPGVEIDPLRTVHFEHSREDRRQVVARLALPATRDNEGYRIVMSAVGIDGSLTEYELPTVPIQPRNVVYDLPSPARAPHWAALVGVGNYPGGTVLPLATPPNDARALRRLLSSPLRRHGPESFDYTHISVLPGGPPAQDGRLEAVKTADFLKLLRGLPPLEEDVPIAGSTRSMHVYRGHVTFFYFAGHGGVQDASPVEELWDPGAGDAVRRKEGCLLLSNTEHGECELDGSILTKNLGDTFRKLKVKGLVSILDFCYSSDARFLSPGLWTYSPRRDHAGGAVTLSASVFEAFELGPLDHGLFTAVVLEGLRGAADLAPDDGRVTVLELWTYAHKRMAGIVRRRGLEVGPAQIPALTSQEWKEELVLVNNAGARALRDGLARQVEAGRLPRDRLPEANMLLLWDPEPTEWRQVLDLKLLEAFAEGALGDRTFDELVDLLSQGQRAALLGGRAAPRP